MTPGVRTTHGASAIKVITQVGFASVAWWPEGSSSRQRLAGWRKPFGAFAQSGQPQQAIENAPQESYGQQQGHGQQHHQQGADQAAQGMHGQQQGHSQQYNQQALEQPGQDMQGYSQRSEQAQPGLGGAHQHQQHQQQRPGQEYIVEEPETQQVSQKGLGQRPEEYHRSNEEFSQSGTDTPPEHTQVTEKYAQSSDPCQQPMSEHSYVHDPPHQERHVCAVAPGSARQDPADFQKQRQQNQPMHGGGAGQQGEGGLSNQQYGYACRGQCSLLLAVLLTAAKVHVRQGCGTATCPRALQTAPSRVDHVTPDGRHCLLPAWHGDHKQGWMRVSLVRGQSSGAGHLGDALSSQCVQG